MVKYTRDSIELSLAPIRKTSPGNDDIHDWVYRDYVHELSDVVTMLANMLIGLGVVPSVWRTAVIMPVPKCTPVGGVNDFRPISATPILSSLVERLI